MKKIVQLNVIMNIFIALALFLFIPFTGNAAQVHRVKSGENIFIIARNYGITTGEIIAKNNLRNPDDIFNKEVLIIPDADRPGIYRVQAGDTLYKISQNLKIPMKILANVNYLNNKDQLYARQPLYIPYRFRFPQTYTVKTGDNLYSISRQFNLTVDEIAMLNNLNNESHLKAGQNLKIPVSPPGQPGYTGPQYTSLFPDTFFLKGSTGSYKIALTFDDGPDENYTPQILNILDKYNVPATFFLIGKRVKKYPEMVKKIEEAGQLVANHTWSHINLTKISKDELTSEAEKTETAIEKIVNQKTSYLRPPEGAVSKEVVQQLKNLDYKVIFWSVDSRDWLAQNVDKILINTLPNVRKDSIILFHSAGGKGENLEPTVKLLPELIDTLRMRGFTFVSLNELLGTPAYK